MGIGVSSWRLAKAVARTGQLGVVSGTAIDLLLTRRLQDGDPGGHMRRALAAFPYPRMSQAILDRYFVEGGIGAEQAYRQKPMIGLQPSRQAAELLVAANFVEVFLAREGHDGLIGINFLQKIQTPTLASIYGAMLAGVAVVIIGAGIPRSIPGILDGLARGESVELKLDTTGPSSDFLMRFDPAEFVGGTPPQLERPAFFPIVSSNLLAKTMVKKANGTVDGLIVEGQTAGGHNAPPRGQQRLDERGEPIYGERDVVDLGAVADLGVPFWLAGSLGSPEGLAEAQSYGAAGIQVGTPFAFCAESDIREDIKRDVHRRTRNGGVRVVTDPQASPTGFPFKVLQLDGTSSDREVYEARQRVCDLGYLREAYELEDGSLGWRCAGEPLDAWVQKGGSIEAAEGRMCLCNSLTANVGHPQKRDNPGPEPTLITSGDSIEQISLFEPGYTASDVVRYLLND